MDFGQQAVHDKRFPVDLIIYYCAVELLKSRPFLGLCVVRIEEKVVPFLRGTGLGGTVAEDGMLPCAIPCAGQLRQAVAPDQGG